MDSIGKLVVLLVVTIVKLVITGMCLAIGFKLGYIVFDLAEAKRKQLQSKKETQQADVAMAV